jgi:hypothetical protein
MCCLLPLKTLPNNSCKVWHIFLYAGMKANTFLPDLYLTSFYVDIGQQISGGFYLKHRVLS